MTSPSLLFVHALELALDKLKAQGAPLHSVVAISGSGQQHGSVYWRTGAEAALRDLSTERSSTMRDQLKDAFAIPSTRATHIRHHHPPPHRATLLGL